MSKSITVPKWTVYYNPKSQCLLIDVNKSFRLDSTKELEMFLNEIYGNLTKANSTSAKLQKLWYNFINLFSR